MENCIFCKIINREIPATITYEDDRVIVFEDINPMAPVHLLIVPKEHIESLKDINEDNADILIDVHLIANKVAQMVGVSSTGYRVVNNCGRDAGQMVQHIHFHLLGGKSLGPKM